MLIFTWILIFACNVLHSWQHFISSETKLGFYPKLFAIYLFSQFLFTTYLFIFFILQKNEHGFSLLDFVLLFPFSFFFNLQNMHANAYFSVELAVMFNAKGHQPLLLQQQPQQQRSNNDDIYSILLMLNLCCIACLYVFESFLHFFRFATVWCLQQSIGSSAAKNNEKIGIVFALYCVVYVFFIAINVVIFYPLVYLTIFVILVFHFVFNMACSQKQLSLIVQTAKRSLSAAQMKQSLAPLYPIRKYSMISICLSSLFLFGFVFCNHNHNDNAMDFLIFYPFLSSVLCSLLTCMFVGNRRFIRNTCLSACPGQRRHLCCRSYHKDKNHTTDYNTYNNNKKRTKKKTMSFEMRSLSIRQLYSKHKVSSEPEPTSLTELSSTGNVTSVVPAMGASASDDRNTNTNTMTMTMTNSNIDSNDSKNANDDPTTTTTTFGIGDYCASYCCCCCCTHSSNRSGGGAHTKYGRRRRRRRQPQIRSLKSHSEDTSGTMRVHVVGDLKLSMAEVNTASIAITPHPNPNRDPNRTPNPNPDPNRDPNRDPDPERVLSLSPTSVSSNGLKTPRSMDAEAEAEEEEEAEEEAEDAEEPQGQEQGQESIDNADADAEDEDDAGKIGKAQVRQMRQRVRTESQISTYLRGHGAFFASPITSGDESESEARLPPPPQKLPHIHPQAQAQTQAQTPPQPLPPQMPATPMTMQSSRHLLEVIEQDHHLIVYSPEVLSARRRSTASSVYTQRASMSMSVAMAKVETPHGRPGTAKENALQVPGTQPHQHHQQQKHVINGRDDIHAVQNLNFDRMLDKHMKKAAAVAVRANNTHTNASHHANENVGGDVVGETGTGTEMEMETDDGNTHTHNHNYNNNHHSNSTHLSVPHVAQHLENTLVKRQNVEHARKRSVSGLDSIWFILSFLIESGLFSSDEPLSMKRSRFERERGARREQRRIRNNFHENYTTKRNHRRRNNNDDDDGDNTDATAARSTMDVMDVHMHNAGMDVNDVVEEHGKRENYNENYNRRQNDESTTVVGRSRGSFDVRMLIGASPQQKIGSV